MTKRILLFSDTHGLHGGIKIPTDIDMAIFAGDAGTFKNPYSNISSVLNFIEWYASLPIPNKIWIAGNHCTSIEAGLVKAKELSLEKGLIYLEHESITIDGLEIFGSPYTPEFWAWAFNVSRNKLRDYWNQIPVTTDILVVHGGPHGVGVAICDDGDVGCVELETVCDNDLKQMFLCVSGHLHEAYGVFEKDGKTYINASVLNDDYKLVRNPFIITVDTETKKILTIEN
jgi:Icc-related predicted phosphoesterase